MNDPAMANRPQPISVTPAETVRAVTIPLLLITLGALFLLDYAGGPSVHQTWLVLLIVWGVGWALTHFLAR